MSTASDPAPGGFDPARLIADHQAGVWRYLRALGCDPALADDLTQETFLQVLGRSFHDYHQAATAAYLRRTAHHLFVSWHRRNRKAKALSDVELAAWEQVGEEWQRWAGDDQGVELLEALRHCLTRLGDRARRALELRYRDQASRAEIAAELSMTEDGAKNLLQRSKKLLRECLQESLRS
jgi:RNA polymerase sigma-70 factor (ECF subfamily)